MTDCLVIVLCLLALFQQVGRRTSALIFSLSCLTHGYFMGDLGGLFYYLSAGFFDVVVIAIICAYLKPSRFNDCLIGLSVLSICFNFYGWVIWYLYLPPESYNIMFEALYLIAILVFLWRDCASDTSYDKRRDSLFLSVRKSLCFHIPLFKKARN